MRDDGDASLLKLCDAESARIAEYVNCLRDGGVLLYPTDTIWGLGCDARNAGAVARIARIKGRDSAKGFLSLMDGIPMLEEYVGALPLGLLSLFALWGAQPVSVVYPGVHGLSGSILAADGSAGFRVVHHELCRRMVRGLGGPLVSTSANASGMSYRPGLEGIPQEIVRAVDMVVHPMFEVDPSRVKASVVLRLVDGGRRVEPLRG